MSGTIRAWTPRKSPSRFASVGRISPPTSTASLPLPRPAPRSDSASGSGTGRPRPSSASARPPPRGRSRSRWPTSIAPPPRSPMPPTVCATPAGSPSPRPDSLLYRRPPTASDANRRGDVGGSASADPAFPCEGRKDLGQVGASDLGEVVGDPGVWFVDLEDPPEVDRGSDHDDIAVGAVDGRLQVLDLVGAVPHRREQGADVGIGPEGVDQAPHEVGPRID